MGKRLQYLKLAAGVRHTSRRWIMALVFGAAPSIVKHIQNTYLTQALCGFSANVIAAVMAIPSFIQNLASLTKLFQQQIQARLPARRFWRNVIVATALYLFLPVLLLSLIFPAVIGSWMIIFGDQLKDLTENPSVAATASIGIAILAGTLAGAVHAVGQTSRWQNPGSIRGVPKWLGRMSDPNGIRTWFLGSAASFGAFALLVPFLAIRARDQHFYPEGMLREVFETIGSAIALLLLTMGGVTLAFALTNTLAFVIVDLFADSQETRRQGG